MKHIMNKTVAEATPQELLLTLMHVNGIGEGPTKIVHAEPVIETLVSVGPDRTARILLFNDDLDTLKELTRPLDDKDMALYGKGEPKTYDELRAVTEKPNE